jgi:hypothetical protein
MTMNATALEMGERVFSAALRNGGDREKAASLVLSREWPDLSEPKKTFLTWALLRAESMYVRTERPALPAEGHGARDAHLDFAPAGGTESGDGQQDHDAHATLAAPDTEGEGGHLSSDAHAGGAPLSPTHESDGGGEAITALQPNRTMPPASRRRLAYEDSGPMNVMVHVPSQGRKRYGDLTRTDVGFIYGQYQRHRKSTEEKERFWKRVYDAMPENTRLAEWDAPAWITEGMAEAFGVLKEVAKVG